jgi:hypothetical protein
MRVLVKVLWNLVVFFAGVVFGHVADKFVGPFIDDFGWDFPKYAHVASYWVKTNRPGAEGERARCEEGPKIDILQEEARFQRSDARLTDCYKNGSPFEHETPDCSLQEKFRAEHLAKLEDAKKKLAACSPQAPPKTHP